MIRICTSLANYGYKVTLVGRKMKQSVPLSDKPFVQKRLTCLFEKGPFFYIEYNLRLWIWLLFQPADCICAIDLDTILPCLFASKLKGVKRVYDAHELFCEMKEIVSRPGRYKLWKKIEQFAVPKFTNGYTVCIPIAQEFKKLYGVDYSVVRNVPLKKDYSNIQQQPLNTNTPIFFIYQGAVNEGRSFETLIPAMKDVNAPLHIYGDGNFYAQTKELIAGNQLEQKVLLKGKLEPHQLQQLTPTAHAGITIFENNGLSNYLSLGNRFFDYIQAGIPQICVDYPAYRTINKSFEVALLIADVKPETISAALNLLLSNSVLYDKLKENCNLARQTLNWQEEEKIVIQFYHSILG
jgi:glycosyltransferase involved in cell wall biosynthesis